METLSSAIQNLSDSILKYALVLAAVGTISMALLELFKSLFLVRAHYHQLMFRKWIGKDHSDVLSEFFLLATGERSRTRYSFWRAIFDQPSEKMLGQIQAAANVALDYPKNYPKFYSLLTRGLEEPQASAPEQPSDSVKWMNYASEPPEKESQEPEGARHQRSREASQARARLSNAVARKLDAFQTNLEYWWARLNQTAAIILGAAIFWYAIHQSKDVHQIDTLTLMVASLLGGLVSPFAKDVVSALSGLRTKRG